MTNPRLEELRAKFQQNPRRYFAPYANELRKTGDPAQAIAVCRTHLASQAGHVSGHIVLGQALYEAGEGNEARDAFTAALELDPENLIALRSLGEIAQVNGDFGAARQWYQRLLDADPRNSEVTQLLRDIPADAPPKPVVVPEAHSGEEPTPFTVREEIAAAEAPSAMPESLPTQSAPTVHTGFTGQGPAYKTEEEREEELAKPTEEAPSAETKEAFIDLQPTAHDAGVEAQGDVYEPMSASTESDPMEFVDIGEETEGFAAEATQEMMPDESFDFVEPSSAHFGPDLSDAAYSEFAPEAKDDQESTASEMATEPQSDFVTDETYTAQASDHAIPSLEIEDFAADALTPTASSQPSPSDETTEPPRAVFAERGFDGSVDEMGWMTTPSQAFSDLEAAPEDWLEETLEEAPTAEADASMTSVEATAPEAVENDSWFDEVAGAGSTEAIDGTSDELWLPPELPQVTNAEDNAHRQEQEAAAEETTETPAWSASPDEAQAVDAMPNVADSDWSEGVDTTAQGEVEETAQQPEQVQASASYAPDESDEAVESGPVHESYANAESVRVDESSVDVHAGETASASVAEEEPTAEPDAHQVDEMPGFVYASEVPAMPSGSAMGQTPTDAVSAPTPAPFLTETLAELYLQQGFRDEALAIYRQLLDRNPTDEALKSRMVALEQAEVSPPSPVRAETRAASQSVRTFFSRLARRPAAAAPHAPDTPSGGSGGGDGGAHPDVPFSVAASALANLFSASKPPQSDEGAASMLAGAFTDPAGRPSRAAEKELSLDHLFRDVAPGGPAAGGGGVTLDEFYSAPNSAHGSTTESGSESGAEDPSGTDIRQFTAWLEGLRKK